MKRSEMVEKIKQHLLDNTVGYDVMDHLNPDDYEINYPLRDAEDILDLIEKAGMLPPMQEIKEYAFQAPNEWDSEDEA